MSRYGRGQPQQPAIVLSTPPGLATATVTDTETVTTTTAATVQGLGTAPIVVTDLTDTYWTLQRQRPAIVSATPPALVTADVSDTETVVTTATASAGAAATIPARPVVVSDPNGTYLAWQRSGAAEMVVAPPFLAGATTADVTDTITATTTTAATVSGLGTAPIVVADLTGTYWSLQRQKPAATLVTPPGAVTADVSDTETVVTTASAQTGPVVTVPAQPTVVSAEPSRAFWNQEHQPSAIVSAAPPAKVTADVSTAETATTTTATTVAGQGTPPIVVSDLTGTYWQLERQRPAIVIISPPGKATADVSDAETVVTTATASAVGPPAPAQPVVYSDQLGPYLRSATSHQPPALFVGPPSGAVFAQVTDTITDLTTATAIGGGSVTADVSDAETATTTTAATVAPPAPGSWWKLLSILKEARDPSFTQPRLLSCPNDGEPFRQGPNGEWYCKFDGYRPGAGQPYDVTGVGP